MRTSEHPLWAFFRFLAICRFPWPRRMAFAAVARNRTVGQLSPSTTLVAAALLVASFVGPVISGVSFSPALPLTSPDGSFDFPLYEGPPLRDYREYPSVRYVTLRRESGLPRGGSLQTQVGVCESRHTRAQSACGRLPSCESHWGVNARLHAITDRTASARGDKFYRRSAPGLTTSGVKMLRKPAPASAHTRAALGPIGLLMSCIPIVLCGLATATEPFGVRALRDLEFDAFQRWSPRPYDASSPVKIAAIDDDSINRLGQWPWPREVMAQLIEKLSAAGAATIVLDVLFSEPERAPQGTTSLGDQRVAQAIAHGRVVLGMPLTDPGAEPEVKAGFAIAGDSPQAFLPRFSGAILPLKSMREGALGLSAMNFIPDRDLVVRELPTVFNVGGRLVPSIAAEALRVAQDATTFVIRSSTASGETDFARESGVIGIKIGGLESPTGQSGAIRIRYSGARSERELPAWKILAGEVEPTTIEGKIVLVGATASALYDLRATPLDNAVPGVHIHAEMIESMLAGAQITRPDFMRGLETLLVLLGDSLPSQPPRDCLPFQAPS